MAGKGRRGRKTKLTPEVRATFIKALKAGAPKVAAAQVAGISVDALALWLKRGLAGEKPYEAFASEVSRTIGEDIVRKQSVITAAALRGDWKAAAWNLERLYPKLYGRTLTPAVGVSVQHDDGDDDSSASGSTRTRFEIYLPDNGRRPQDIAEDDEHA